MRRDRARLADTRGVSGKAIYTRQQQVCVYWRWLFHSIRVLGDVQPVLD